MVRFCVNPKRFSFVAVSSHDLCILFARWRKAIKSIYLRLLTQFKICNLLLFVVRNRKTILIDDTLLSFELARPPNKNWDEYARQTAASNDDSRFNAFPTRFLFLADKWILSHFSRRTICIFDVTHHFRIQHSWFRIFWTRIVPLKSFLAFRGISDIFVSLPTRITTSIVAVKPTFWLPYLWLEHATWSLILDNFVSFSIEFIVLWFDD